MELATPLYDSAFELFQTYIYGNVVLSADQSLVCTMLATVASIAVVAVPFFLVYSGLKFIFGWR